MDQPTPGLTPDELETAKYLQRELDHISRAIKATLPDQEMIGSESHLIYEAASKLRERIEQAEKPNGS